MSVPDWPTTFGYNLFLYPWQTWLFGPWDLFIEHGHRLFASLVGMLTIALCVSLWMTKQPKWLQVMGLVALAGVIFQGVLGGMRVRLDQRLLAMIHGCFGPAFFAFAAVLATVTARGWAKSYRTVSAASGVWLRRVAVVVPVLAYSQLALGASETFCAGRLAGGVSIAGDVASDVWIAAGDMDCRHGGYVLAKLAASGALLVPATAARGIGRCAVGAGRGNLDCEIWLASFFE